jgi:hypothetical protein
MYIEFDLPFGSATANAWDMVNQKLDQALKAWANRYEIEYRTKNVKYKKRVTFNDERCYEFFLLTWKSVDQQNFWTTYRLVTDLNNKI